jgi:threonine/homoserine/homoserine lactone efflux protein
MPKALCITGMVVAILVLILFLVDLAIGVPFKRASTTLDVVFMISAMVLAYMSWSTLKEQ